MKQVNKQGAKNKIGAYGEQIAARYLKNQGFSVLDINYQKKWGELDIVARETQKTKEIIHFIEVKTVSYETKADLEYAVTHETWAPEDNVHRKKIESMNRTIESWLAEHDCESDWQIDIVAVRVVPREKYATVSYLPNIIL